MKFNSVWSLLIGALFFVIVNSNLFAELMNDETDSQRGSEVEKSFEEEIESLVVKKDSVVMDAKDPFEAFLLKKSKPKKVVKKKRKKSNVPQLKISPPAAKIEAILWGKEPVAIVKWNGQTHFMKKGKMHEGYKLVRIEKKQVVFAKSGKKFTVSK